MVKQDYQIHLKDCTTYYPETDGHFLMLTTEGFKYFQWYSELMKFIADYLFLQPGQYPKKILGFYYGMPAFSTETDKADGFIPYHAISKIDGIK